jgi:GNAT superfamily N-acetyltransferase
MESPDVRIVPLTPALAGRVQGMTFPAYRHLLPLNPVSRHPLDGDLRHVQPLGLVALAQGHPVGLVLAEIPLGDSKAAAAHARASLPLSSRSSTSALSSPPSPPSASSPSPPEMLSLSVTPDHRHRGVATRLVEGLEQTLRDRGAARVDAVYMTGKPGIEAVERILAARRWQAPAARTYTMRFTVDQAERMPWYGRVPLRASEFEIFPWAELDASTRASLIASQRERPWMTPGLEFWKHDAHGFDAVSSLGLRHGGEVVGWTITHRLAPDLTRISGAFVRDDLSRRGRLMALWTASIARMRADGVRWISSITPVQLGPMVAFLAHRCAPWATFFGETRGSHKQLAPRSVQ